MKRRIDLEGCDNFRDLGGYPTADGRSVRWRRIFRSDALHRLSGTDVERLRDEFRVHDVIDLRSTIEREDAPNVPLIMAPFRHHHTPLFDGETRSDRAERPRSEEILTLADRYVSLAELAQPRVARVLEIVATSSEAVVFHCAAGKDRTGIVSAVLLGIAGVPDEVIATDYAATRDSLDTIVERLMATEGYRSMLSLLPPDTLHAEPETMLDLLRRLREKYGSIRDYALAAGVAPATLDRLQDQMLEPV